MEPKIKFFEGEPSETVAKVEILPIDTEVDDLGVLVKCLYEGYLEGGVRLERSGPLTSLTGKLPMLNVATYKAAWTDEETKLELVVETNFIAKSLGGSASERDLHTWRRLPVQEVDGRRWVPFGRKPNVSQERMRRALEAKKETVAVGELAWQPGGS